MKIMIIDNNRLFREGIVELLLSQNDMEVVGESEVSEDAVHKAIDVNPDIILLDTGLSHTFGIDVMRRILARRPNIFVIILTMQDTDELFYEVISHGAKGYLLKSINRSVLLSALRALGRGEAIIPRNLVRKILEEFSRLGRLASYNNSDKDFSLLTYREQEILRKLEIRATNREIAEQLGISENTVRVHVGSILGKLHLRNRREASDFIKRRMYLYHPVQR
jgi:DNA-binding NarL/FixJ family response regulator